MVKRSVVLFLLCAFQVVVWAAASDDPTDLRTLQTISETVNFLKQNPSWNDLKANVTFVIQKAQENIIKTTHEESWWQFAPYLGNGFISNYYMMFKWFNVSYPTEMDAAKLKAELLSTQLPDGSWQQVPDPNLSYGSIDTTFFNWWALKGMGEDPESPVLVKARDWIRAHGGPEKCMLMTKYFMCLTHQYPWSSTPDVPLFIFLPDWIGRFVNLRDRVAQWVWPHLIPMAYLRAVMLSKDVGEEYDIDELYPPEQLYLLERARKEHEDRKAGKVVPNWTMEELRANVEALFEVQRPLGSFGAYTISTLFGLYALQDFKQRDPSYAYRIDQSTKFGLKFVEMNYFDLGTPYKGTLDDGRYWDTILSALGLYESGYSDMKILQNAGKYLSNHQVECGGIPYGVDFEYKPDVDDTAEVVKYWHYLNMTEERDTALSWLLQMQNDDGGWGAFDKNRGPDWLVEKFAGKFSDSAELFDPSRLDVAAHILEAYGVSGNARNPLYKYSISRGVEFIRKLQNESGCWWARWGSNYIYGTGFALMALHRVEIPISDPAIQKGLAWLASVQNKDGGWGESTYSYEDPKWAGKGISTPSQTAWALLGLLESGANGPYAEAIRRGVAWLCEDFVRNGNQFIDKVGVGTGHPHIFMMVYPVYPRAFTLMALGKWIKEVRA